MSDVMDGDQRCKRCNRKLTDRQSVSRGYGRKCWRIMNAQPLLIPEIGEENPIIKADYKQNRFVFWIKNLFKNFDPNEAHIRVGREWMTVTEYNRRYRKGEDNE